MILRGIPKSVGSTRKVVAPARVEILKDDDVEAFEQTDLTTRTREQRLFLL